MEGAEAQRYAAMLRERDGVLRHPARAALAKLSADRSPTSVRVLAEAIADEVLPASAASALAGLTEQDAVDALLDVWDSRRHPALTDVLVAERYVAAAPPSRRLETALKAERYDIVEALGPSACRDLLSARGDRDPDIVQRGRETLMARLGVYAEELCRLAIDEGNALAALTAMTSGLSPKDATARAVFFFLTKQWERYSDLDLDGSMLRAAYERAEPDLRRRIAEHARESGRMELVDLTVGDRRGVRLVALTEAEWSAIRSVIASSRSYESGWRLVREAPPTASRRLLMLLEQEGWHPEDEADRERFRSLLELAVACPVDAPPDAVRGVRTLSSGGAGAVKTSPSGTLVAAVAQGCLRVWLGMTGAAVAELPFPVEPWAPIALGEDVLAAGVGQSVLVWRRPFDAPPVELACGIQASGLAISPDDRRVVVMSSQRGGVVQVWDLDSRRLQIELQLSGTPVWAGFSADGRRLAVHCSEGRNTLWSVPDFEIVKRMPRELSGPMAFSHDGANLLVGGFPADVFVLRSSDGSLTTRVKGTFTAFGPSPHGRRVYTGSPRGRVESHMIADGGIDLRFEAQNDRVKEIAVMTGGADVVVTTSYDGRLAFHALPSPVTEIGAYAVSPATTITLAAGGLTLVLHNEEILSLLSVEPAALSACPLAQVDTTALERLADDSRISEGGSRWLKFISALVSDRQRFDIELEDASARVSVGVFDIEIEG